MARNQHAGPSTLRNRNRVTNKTRLKVIKESIDADPIVLDEDEEKARVVSTAGVDAEDANEHHLQAVLSAAATRHHTFTRSTRGAEKEKEKEAPPAAYIPTPDSTGKVDNYEDLYPGNKWRDTFTYLKSSDSVEESTSFALAGGIIYYMDERDKEWLDKNNEEARGEGPSKRPSRKGKEPETVAVSEDEFELVMAIFEKVTHDTREFLHHNFQDVPPFTDYEDTFSSPLSPSMFALYEVPTWIPQPAQLCRLARVVYPHWRSRRVSRDGHPIIPVVNLDESDTKNESYICFRRRESKAVRKTRAQQATYSDKMIRLQGELSTAMDLAKHVLQREAIKRDAAAQGKSMWEKRFAMVDIKRKFPSLGTKEDEELFQDKERVPKRIKTDVTGRLPLKLRTPRDPGDYGSPVAAEPMMKPKDRTAMIQAQIEEELAKRKDHRWEDVVDSPYQPSQAPYSSRLFKYIASSRSTSSESSGAGDTHRHRAARVRFGRGGRRYLDRRMPGLRVLPHHLATDSSDSSESDSDDEQQWRYDIDDVPAVGPAGPDEQDRTLVDDYAIRYLVHSSTLLSEDDTSVVLMADPTMVIHGPDGRPSNYVPFRQSMHPQTRPLMSRYINVPQQGVALRHPNASMVSVASSSSSSSSHQRPMLPPHAMPQQRIPSNGIMRPPSTPTVPTVPSHPTVNQSSPSTALNGTGHDQMNGTVAAMDQEMKAPVAVAVHPVPQASPDLAHADIQAASLQSVSPVRPKSQTPSMTAIPNGFTIPAVNNYASHLTNGTAFAHPGVRPNGLSNQQMLKSAFANLSPGSDGSLQVNNGHLPMRTPTNSYMGHTPNYPAQLAAARQMQWTMVAQQSRAPAVNIADANGLDVGLTGNISPPISGAPVRVPSAAGTRSLPLSRGMTSPALAQAMVAGQGRSSPANAHASRLTPHPHSPNLLSPGLVNAQVQQSPPRPPQAHIPSPSLQARQIVGSSGF